MHDDNTHRIIAELDFEREFDALRTAIDRWIENADAEIQAALEWQFHAGSKYFRPLTIFSCHRALHGERIPASVIRAAAVLEMFHNVSLIVDDIVDKSTHRRGKPTLHAKFGELPAFMVSGYIVADGFAMISDPSAYADDPHADSGLIRENLKLLSELLKRLGVAECMQWRLRRKPLGLPNWLAIAGEDTGSMFEVCASLGARKDTLRAFGRLLGILYHGCDDVGDVRGAAALGGGGDEDLRDGILTLPAALAIEDPAIRDVFCKNDPTDADLAILRHAFARKIDDAERYLDGIADEAREIAKRNTRTPNSLISLVDHTRQLSHR